MKILLIDDHAMFRHGLMSLLQGLDSRLEFAQASSVAEALQHTGPFDLVLLDMHMAGLQGTDALAAVRTGLADSPIVVVSGDDDPSLILRCIQLGACGFVHKSLGSEVLIPALRAALDGVVYLPAKMLKTPDATPEPMPRDFAGLSQRQFEVLGMVIHCGQNKVIARAMGLSEGTIKQHLSACYKALGVRNRTEAVIRAAELKLKFPAPNTLAAAIR